MDKKGFSLVELLLIMGIITILLSFSSLNLFKTKHNISLDTTLSVLISDLKYQQLKAMAGDTEGRLSHDAYGIRFYQNRYILFHSPTFSPTDNTNFTINLDNGVEFSNIDLPNSQIIFASASGEFGNFNQEQNTLVIKNSLSNDQKRITINRYGVVTAVN